MTSSTTIELHGAEFSVDPAELAAVAFLARYSGRTLDAYRHDLRNLFSGRPITAYPCSKPAAPTLRCTARRWKNGDWPPRQSTGVSPPPAASTASRTSTAGSRPTPLSTFAARRCTHQSSADWTVPSSAALIPLVPRTARKIDLAVGERREGPIL
ncbi:MAG TPA: hypothetical protein VFV02_12045, partial [Acidimicrobiales bacterium]|nr:hypothetical protein [Acidimicrobiales bacterium]